MSAVVQVGQHQSAVHEMINRREFKMNIIRKFCLASILALSIAAPVQAQTAQQGDYYAPGPTTPLHATPGQVLKIKEGDYYVGETVISTKSAQQPSKRALIASALRPTVTWRACRSWA